MKYYSDKVKKVFETVEELEKAEKAFDQAKEEAERKATEKKDRAKAVEEALTNAQNISKEAYQKYYDLRNEFIKDYGSYHMSYTNGNIKIDDSPLATLNSFLSCWPW